MKERYQIWRIRMRRRFCKGKSPCYLKGQWGCVCRHHPNSKYFKGSVK